MVDVEDVQQFGQRLRNQLDYLETADISERDREAIQKLVRRLDTDGLATSTIAQRCLQCRLTAERIDGNLVDMDRDDVDAYLFERKRDHDDSEGTIRNYRKSLKRFFEHRGEEWAADISIGAPPQRRVEPDELLTQDEIDALFSAAKSARDSALLGLLLDTGLRIGAIASLRVRDVDLTDRAGRITVTDAVDGQKAAGGTVPLTWARGYVANWLDVHPRSDESEAALIHTRKDDDPDDDGALTYYSLQRHLKRLADRADVARSKVNPHNFRKTAISQWIRDGLSEQEIKHRATWTEDSDQFATYSGVSDEELNEQILGHYDLGGEDSAGPTMDACLQCGTSLPDHADFCPGCAAPLNQSAASRIQAVDDALVEGAIDAPTSEHQHVLLALRRLARSDPRLRTALEDEFGH